MVSSTASDRCTRLTVLAVLAVVTGWLAGCEVGPNYKKPVVPFQSEWEEAGRESSSVSASVIPAAPPPDWWVLLNDKTLNALVLQGWQGNLDVKIAASRIQEARAARAIAGSGLYPALSASGSYDFYRADGPLFPVKTTDYQFYTTGFDAIWEADIFGRVRRNVEAARADLEAEVEVKRGALVTVSAEIARDYVELRTSQQRQIIARDNIKTQTETLDLARRLHSAGIVGDFDISRARTELAQTQSQLPVLRIQEKSAVHQLSILLGRPPEALANELHTAGAIPLPPREVPIGLPSELLRRRPDVRQVERQLAAATARIGVAEADLYPKVTITGDLGVGSQNFGSLFDWSNRYVGIGPNIQWQLFEGGRIVANIDAHKAIRQELLDQYKLTILRALGEAEDALVAFNRRQEEFDLLKYSVESSQESVRIASDRYAAGTIDYLSLLDAERSLLQTQDAMAVSQGEIATSVIALYKAIGGGWENGEQLEGNEVAIRSER